MTSPLREVVADALPEIEQQARELLALALDERGRPTDAAEVREGRNPFVRGEYALAAIESALAIPLESRDGLPLLPVAAAWMHVDAPEYESPVYTADQMREYARAALATLPTQSAGVEERARELLAQAYAELEMDIPPVVWTNTVEFSPPLRAIAAALRTPASEGDGGRVVADKGPWRWLYKGDIDGGGAYELESADFAHDVTITVSGDFADHDDVMRYMAWLRDTLNAATTPPTQQEARAVDAAVVTDAVVDRLCDILWPNNSAWRKPLLGTAKPYQEQLRLIVRDALTAALHPGAKP